ncbi:MAG: 16S rRNA (guanine(527)-N(7))-methyltransferase RsmG [Clostridia bacterium]|nr:16S rRNA (guanine(527)-N(7))-methyltransferase RsmG [Clostridia bacterium]
MREIFNEFSVKVSDLQAELFEKYFNLLIEYNQKFNITAITDKKEVYVKHFIDSILVVDKFITKENLSMIDVGSGGGFPAIPVKIMRDDLSLTLLEATGKKCEFLKTVVKKLGLKNVTVINDRAETLAKNENYREKFDICSARAVARLNTLCEYCMPFVKVDGNFIAYKGDAEEEVTEALNAVKILGGKVEETYLYELDGAKRTLVKIKKTKNTDKKYPRGNGKERKNPL